MMKKKQNKQNNYNKKIRILYILNLKKSGIKYKFQYQLIHFKKYNQLQIYRVVMKH